MALMMFATRRPEAPDIAEQLNLGEDPTRLGGQRAAQRVLLAGQLHLPVADPDLAGGGVDEQLADAARPEPAGIAATEDGGDPRHQLAVVERLANGLFVCADPRGRQPMRVCALCGTSLAGMRSDAHFCSGAHRAEAARIRAILAAVEAGPIGRLRSGSKLAVNAQTATGATLIEASL
jgi:hypothetical protein